MITIGQPVSWTTVGEAILEGSVVSTVAITVSCFPLTPSYCREALSFLLLACCLHCFFQKLQHIAGFQCDFCGTVLLVLLYITSNYLHVAIPAFRASFTLMVFSNHLIAVLALCFLFSHLMFLWPVGAYHKTSHAWLFGAPFGLYHSAHMPLFCRNNLLYAQRARTLKIFASSKALFFRCWFVAYCLRRLAIRPLLTRIIMLI